MAGALVFTTLLHGFTLLQVSSFYQPIAVGVLVIAIGRAASWGSTLVIMDEPTAALGVRERESVEQLIGRLRADDIAQLIISHDLEQVMRVADTVWIMRRGTTIAHWRVADVSRERIVAAITGADGGDHRASAADERPTVVE